METTQPESCQQRVVDTVEDSDLEPGHGSSGQHLACVRIKQHVPGGIESLRKIKLQNRGS